MAVSPPLSSTASKPLPTLNYPERKKSNISTPEQEASSAEKDARTRVVKAQQTVEEATRQEQTQLDKVRDQYIKLTEEEVARQENSVENQKQKGYEELRKLKMAQDAELNRVRRQGEQDLKRIQDHYNHTIHNAELEGNRKLFETTRQQGQILDYEQKSGALEIDHTKTANEQRLTELKNDQDAKFQSIFESSNKEYERLRENTSQANEQAHEKFQKNYTNTLNEHQRVIADLNNKASHQVRTIRADTSGKLAAYSDRQEDPFYKLVSLNAELKEYDDSYVLTATIPEHEQQHVTASIKGGNLVISGSRKNEEKLATEDGKTQSTSTFQSFNESFPITWPVDSRRLSKVFDGETLIVSVPKKSQYVAAQKMYKAKNGIERIQVEKPKFPENLPHVKTEPLPDSHAAAPEPTKKAPGSTTLT